MLSPYCFHVDSMLTWNWNQCWSHNYKRIECILEPYWIHIDFRLSIVNSGARQKECSDFRGPRIPETINFGSQLEPSPTVQNRSGLQSVMSYLPSLLLVWATPPTTSSTTTTVCFVIQCVQIWIRMQCFWSLAEATTHNMLHSTLNIAKMSHKANFKNECWCNGLGHWRLFWRLNS